MVRDYEINTFKRCKWFVAFFFESCERINQLYPEIYSGGTSEGSGALDYFIKWGWYASIDTLAKGKVWKHKVIEEMGVHEFHIALAHTIDKKKMKADIHKKDNSTIQF